MARKPKATSGTEISVTAAEQEHAAPDEGLAPVRRGRPPKAAKAPARSSAKASNPTEMADHEASGAPTATRRGRKPVMAEAPAEPEDTLATSEAEHEHATASGSDAGDGHAVMAEAPHEAPTHSASPDLTASSKPAAQWDRTTDTVHFDWPEIEQTASQQGPNQAMAKLLVAARTEGATSRWPF